MMTACDDENSSTLTGAPAMGAGVGVTKWQSVPLIVVLGNDRDGAGVCN
jgi:hypothetical protein